MGGEPRPGRVVSWWHQKAPAWEQGCAGSKRCWLSGAGPGGLGAQCMLSLADVRVLRGGLGTESLLLHIASHMAVLARGLLMLGQGPHRCEPHQDRAPAQAP